jgi:chromosome segregation ATPase
MKTFVATSLVLVGAESAVSELTFDVAAAKNRPVTKVITLLKDMLKQLEKEAEEDEEIYDQLACWCETNDKEKTKSIADAEASIEDLTNKIEELTASSARLGTEIKNLEKEVAENQEALDSATAIRQKELAEFNAEEKDALAAISALKSAVTVLGKHHGGAFLQVSSSTMSGIAASVQMQLAKHSEVFKGVLTHHERRALAAFIQSPADYFDAEPTFKQSYAPQSGEIFGILNQMKESFETNLADSQKEEMTNQKAYEDLKAAKVEEIKAGQDQIDKKTQELASTDEKLAESKENLEDTKKSLAADEEFLMMLKEKCSGTDAEWEERQKTRQLEMEACSKALAVLSSDDAHDLFTKTFNPAFVQTESKAKSERRSKASSLLKAVANKLNSPRLAAIATKVRLDAFVKVKKAIDDMVAQLLKEKADEIKHKDFCVEEFNSNQLQTEKKDREKEDLLALIEDLELTIKTLTAEIDTLKSEVAELQVQMKRAGENREKENKEFQQTVADQRASQKLLGAALSILKGFYEKKAALLQQEPAGPPPPPGFKEYKKNESAGGVMGMIQQIINDAKAMEADAIRSEEDAQKAYEDFVKETNASIEAKTKGIINKSEEKAKGETDLTQANTDKEAVLLELEQLSNYNAELHQSCDFVMKNFEIRQTARDEEIEALKQAKAILSGADFNAFLQQY